MSEGLLKPLISIYTCKYLAVSECLGVFGRWCFEATWTNELSALESAAKAEQIHHRDPENIQSSQINSSDFSKEKRLHRCCRLYKKVFMQTEDKDWLTQDPLHGEGRNPHSIQSGEQHAAGGGHLSWSPEQHRVHHKVQPIHSHFDSKGQINLLKNMKRSTREIILWTNRTLTCSRNRAKKKFGKC